MCVCVCTDTVAEGPRAKLCPPVLSLARSRSRPRSRSAGPRVPPSLDSSDFDSKELTNWDRFSGPRVRHDGAGPRKDTIFRFEGAHKLGPVRRPASTTRRSSRPRAAACSGATSAASGPPWPCVSAPCFGCPLCVCVCVRACVRACACVPVCVRAWPQRVRRAAWAGRGWGRAQGHAADCCRGRLPGLRVEFGTPQVPNVAFGTPQVPNVAFGTPQTQPRCQRAAPCHRRVAAPCDGQVAADRSQRFSPRRHGSWSASTTPVPMTHVRAETHCLGGAGATLQVAAARRRFSFRRVRAAAAIVRSTGCCSSRAERTEHEIIPCSVRSTGRLSPFSERARAETHCPAGHVDIHRFARGHRLRLGGACRRAPPPRNDSRCVPARPALQERALPRRRCGPAWSSSTRGELAAGNVCFSLREKCELREGGHGMGD